VGTDHLVAWGHKRIGFIGGAEGIETAAERLFGYQKALLAARFRPLPAVEDYRLEGGTRAAREFLARRANALLVANNLLAVDALNAIKKAGMRIAADIALISVHDPPWAELIDPPLTTLSQAVRAMADTAVELLLGRLEGRRKRRKCQVFEFELHHRGSCC
jgi:LacI family transcriptional regulator